MTTTVAACTRTPSPGSPGVFSDVPATVPGAHAMTAALERAGVALDDVLQMIAG